MERKEYEKLAFLEGTCGWNIGRRRIIADTLRTCTGGADDLDVLEVGCGTGGNIDVLKKSGRVHGLDASPIALEHAKTKGFDGLLLGAVESMPYAAGAFDVVAAFDMLEHIHDDERALKEVLRVLKDDGVLILTVPAHPGLWTQHDVALHHHRRYTVRGLRDKIAAAGFHIEKLSLFMMPTVPYLFIRGLLDRLKGVLKRGKATSYYGGLPWPINKGMSLWLEAENGLLKITTLPFGGSILAVARKRADAHFDTSR